MAIIKRIVKAFLGKRKQKEIAKKAKIGKNVCTTLETVVMCSSPEQVCIGDNSEIACTLACQGNGKIRIGKNAWIGAKTVIGSVEEIVIGDYAIIYTEVHIYDNNNHPISPKQRQQMSESGFHSDLWK